MVDNIQELFMKYHIKQEDRRYHFDNVFNPPLKLSMVDLYQAGELVVGNGYEIADHEQICNEISYVISGNCDFYSNGKVFHAKKGDVHIISKGMKHKIVVGENKTLRMAYIGFDNNAVPELQKFFQKAPLFLLNDKQMCRTLFEQLLKELIATQVFYEDMIDTYVKQIIVHVYRLFQNDGGYNMETEKINLKNIVGPTVFQTLRYIDNHVNGNLTVAQIATDLKYNPTYLSRVFHEKMDITLRQYIKDRKLEEGKKMLREGLSIGEIASLLGYSSSQSFSKMFLRCVGCSPTAYKNERSDIGG